MEIIVAIIGSLLVVIPLWRICTRAGYNGALSLIAFIPWLGMLIVGAILSFSTWPQKQSTTNERQS